MSFSQPSADVIERARARLRGVGIPEARIAVLLERAAPLLRSMEELAVLDPELPEPALTWQPIDEVTR